MTNVRKHKNIQIYSIMEHNSRYKSHNSSRSPKLRLIQKCVIYKDLHVLCGPGSSVGIATELRAGLSGDRIPAGGEIFRTCPDRPWGSPSFLYNGYPVFPGGKERLVHDSDPSPPSSAVGHERVELYLYSPYEPYGLYRASVPVQGCTLPLVLHILSSLHSIIKILHSLYRFVLLTLRRLMSYIYIYIYIYIWSTHSWCF